MKRAIWMFVMLIAFPATAAEVDTIYLDEAVIEGNQELPRVLYILPWQEQTGEPISAQSPTLSAVDWMQPIYPDEHRRSLRLQQILNTSTLPPPSTTPSTTPTTPSTTVSQGE